MLQAWIDHRREVIIRRTRFLLARDEARLHIVAGLLKAVDIIDEIIALIRASQSAEEAARADRSLGFLRSPGTGDSRYAIASAHRP